MQIKRNAVLQPPTFKPIEVCVTIESESERELLDRALGHFAMKHCRSDGGDRALLLRICSNLKREA